MAEEREGVRLAEGKYQDGIHEFIAGRARRSAGFDMGEPHYHPYHELYYVISGRCRMFVQHDIYYASAGDILFFPPYSLHRSCYEKGQTVDRFVACFTPGYIRAFTETRDAYIGDHETGEGGAGEGAGPVLFPWQKLTVPQPERERVEQLFADMIRETLQRDCYTDLQKKSLLFQLLTLLGRCRQPALLQGSQQLEQGDGAVQTAARFIYQHHREPVSLAQAADVGHLSPTYFSKRFRQVTGMGFKEYLTHVRLLDAMQLLKTTGMSITDIALTCGFSDGNYFGDVFKKAQGISPDRFRKGLGFEAVKETVQGRA